MNQNLLELSLVEPRYAAKIAAQGHSMRQEGVTEADVRAACEDCSVYGAFCGRQLVGFLAFMKSKKDAIGAFLEEKAHLFIAPGYTGFRVAEQLLRMAAAHRAAYSYDADFRTRWTTDLYGSSLALRRDLLGFGFTAESQSWSSWLMRRPVLAVYRCDVDQKVIDDARLDLHLFLAKGARVQTPFATMIFKVDTSVVDPVALAKDVMNEVIPGIRQRDREVGQPVVLKVPFGLKIEIPLPRQPVSAVLVSLAFVVGAVVVAWSAQ